MTDKAAASKKKAPEVEATTIEEEDLFEDFALKDGMHFFMYFFSCIRFLLSALKLEKLLANDPHV